MATDKDTVVVFTSENRQEILDKAGTGHWVINPKNASRCRYVVCCRKADWKNRADGIAQRAAFLVGRIAGLTRIDASSNARGQARYLIGISDYAEVDRPEVWRRDVTNPVGYSALKALGIDPRRLAFKPAEPSSTARPLTIAEAKQALAATFGVTPEDVEIIIRG
ncbi:methyl coenzyme M reductase subunit C [Bradyrhizobium sp. USDA 4518]